MKNLTILIFCLFCFQSFAQEIEVDILSTEIGIEDQHFKPSLCLTVVRVPTSGALIGVIEDIRDCFYTRKANKASTSKMKIDLTALKSIKSPALGSHLQKMDSQLEFLFSEGE